MYSSSLAIYSVLKQCCAKVLFSELSVSTTIDKYFVRAPSQQRFRSRNLGADPSFLLVILKLILWLERLPLTLSNEPYASLWHGRAQNRCFGEVGYFWVVAH